jgi:hypothetical protein
MKIFLIILMILSAENYSSAQPLADTSATSEQILLDVQKRQTTISRMSMTSLNAWAVSNIGYSSIAYGGSTGQTKYFHQMNIFWNIVNLGIGVPGLIGTYKEKPHDFESIFKYQKKLETVYLLNMGLDVGYMSTGWALNNFGKTKEGEIGERFKGYGNSLVMQGAYLFVHDIVQFFLYKTNNKGLDIVWKRVVLQPTGTGLILRFK